jgi:hypothetical protein
MMTSLDKTRKGKKPGRPPTGTDPLVGLRMPTELRKAIEAWAGRQKDKPTLSAAIRRLVEKGLADGIRTAVTGGHKVTVRKQETKEPELGKPGAAGRRGLRRADRWRIRRSRRALAKGNSA